MSFRSKITIFCLALVVQDVLFGYALMRLFSTTMVPVVGTIVWIATLLLAVYLVCSYAWQAWHASKAKELEKKVETSTFIAQNRVGDGCD